MKKFLDKNNIVLASLLLLTHLSSAAGVQGFDASIPGKKMTLQQCFQLADRQNLALQSGRKAVEKAQVMQGTAWDLDKTEIAFSQNPASSGDTDNGLTFSQSIEFPTVYSTSHPSSSDSK